METTLAAGCAAIESMFRIAYITDVLDLFRAPCVDSLKFESFKLLEAKIEVALSTERPSEQSKHELCHAVHVIITEYEGKNACQGVSFDGRRSGLAKSCV